MRAPWSCTRGGWIPLSIDSSMSPADAWCRHVHVTCGAAACVYLHPVPLEASRCPGARANRPTSLRPVCWDARPLAHARQARQARRPRRGTVGVGATRPTVDGVAGPRRVAPSLWSRPLPSPIPFFAFRGPLGVSPAARAFVRHRRFGALAVAAARIKNVLIFIPTNDKRRVLLCVEVSRPHAVYTADDGEVRHSTQESAARAVH